MICVGLRVDVDTLRGTRLGVSQLVDILAEHQSRASFFFSVGPDNMGRHLWRLLRPTFLLKMLRTSAASLYGWDILLRGTFFPGPEIGKLQSEPIRQAAQAEHEIGLHAWDHHRWQTQIEHLSPQVLAADIAKGYEALTAIIGRRPDCFAAPAWRVTPAALQVLEQFSFRYRSDCRGTSIFRPVVAGRVLNQAEIPTTLPTYDEVIGQHCTAATYNDYLLDLIRPGQLNVLTIHAEAEGISCLPMFREFLAKARQRKMVFVPLGSLLAQAETIGTSAIQQMTLAGREGWLACQQKATSDRG